MLPVFAIKYLLVHSILCQTWLGVSCVSVSVNGQNSSLKLILPQNFAVVSSSQFP